MKAITILILIIILNSCREKKIFDKPINQNEVVTMSNISNYDSITNLVKNKGDIVAYDELYYFLMDSNKEDRTDTVMYYSKIMAEKYSNEKAYYDYFKAFCEKYSLYIDYSNFNKINLSKLPIQPRRTALEWLNKMLDKKIITQQQYNSVKK
ncbi:MULTISPECIES: hypothetical protein [unclassified Chryseobacterium]|uniref:hypothetical protein n=1 Tax=unclassified Chryseobacterium TaxID=2593645 RepID=UPI00226AFAC4|nr:MULTISPECIES: hypothetical protein [unclassified Chryseobacterium]